ncbi:Eco29kI family restriction endonuclease [Massilia sp. CCM 9210]|uniref:Eco29kI family restriction endonuclease n=1 Tax=Massilia scottii TaxID=3057166 RepID=UPI0027969C65|nr:Eco29kI family restriction endonuclease [Massilia sp. CCM 9210]MDQ1815485.1 Eco29kI family restriction endonuclease [Massilia sp. CCM 9210]
MAKLTVQTSAINAMLAELDALTRRIKSVDVSANPKVVKKIRQDLENASIQLSKAANGLDPILRPDKIFDPSDPNTAGRMVALTLVAQQRHPLARIPDFYGAGIYAIYYNGEFPPYASLTRREHPIYVGKADPDNPSAKDAIRQGAKLSVRLNEHARNIRKAHTTLAIEDFECRFLIVQTGFQKSAEDYLINFFQPIWNSETKICFGLGKHGDSSDTRGNKRSPWDTMHPGREWANRTTEDQKPQHLIVEQIETHLRSRPPYGDIHEIFDHFMEHMRQLSKENFSTPASGHVELEEAATTSGVIV